MGKRKVDQRDRVQDLIPGPAEKSVVPDPDHGRSEERGRAAPVIRREGMTVRHQEGDQGPGRREDDSRIEDRSRALKKERRRKRRKRNCLTETFILNRSWPAQKENGTEMSKIFGNNTVTVPRYQCPLVGT